MTAALRFDPIRLPEKCEQLRKEVRAFLAEEIAAGTFDPHKPNREDTDAPEFSRRVGAKGWLGMTWPKKYGGQERSFLERYVVTEEMRVANAPTRRFFVADRQSGPVLIKYAPEHIKMDILPRICRGEICFAIGMSEPNSGSDLFAAKTRATKTDGGYLINGTKIWTSSAHIADYMIAIFRTSQPTKENRRHGLTQFLVKMKQPGIQVNPIGQITGQHEFNEVVFTDFFVPEDHVLGEVDGAWKQATSELAYERSGPERFLETYYVLTELVRAVGPNPDTRSAEGIGRLVAQLHTMRRMSFSVASTPCLQLARRARSKGKGLRLVELVCPDCGKPTAVPVCSSCGAELQIPASDRDQTAAERDQTASDQDQTWSDHDQTASDRDQRSSEDDQHAADDDLAAGGDAATHERSSRARGRTTQDRDAVSRLRDETAEGRLDVAEARDHDAALRDRGAEARDALARMHDEESDATASPDEIVVRAERDRARAAADRVKAASDRARAAADRREAAHERAEAVKQRADSAEDLKRLTTDELTGTRTRMFGLEEVSRELARAHRVGGRLVLAFVDVDGLKQVNDDEGHLAGDALLKLVGETIRANVRPYDLTVRYGGDEFVCAMSNVSSPEARARFEEIAAALKAVNPEHSVTFGIAEADRGDSLQDLLARADADLLEARRTRPAG